MGVGLNNYFKRRVENIINNQTIRDQLYNSRVIANLSMKGADIFCVKQNWFRSWAEWKVAHVLE